MSATQAEARDHRAVALDVGLLQVVQETATLAHEQQQTTTAVVVVLVHLEVFGEVRDAVAQERDLHLGGTGVALDGGVLGNDLLLGICVSTNRHVELPIFRLVARRAGACSPGHSGSAAVVTACHPRGQPQKHIEALDGGANPRRAQLEQQMADLHITLDEVRNDITRKIGDDLDNFRAHAFAQEAAK